MFFKKPLQSYVDLLLKDPTDTAIQGHWPKDAGKK